MTRVVSAIGVGLVALWVVAHLLYLGPVQVAVQAALAWLAGLTAVSALIAGVTVLAWGLVQGRTTPTWLRFVGYARTVAIVLGSGLVIVGLLRYRDTEPKPDVAWIVAGVAILMAAMAVHLWLSAAARRDVG
jgi:hypothetical protein